MKRHGISAPSIENWPHAPPEIDPIEITKKTKQKEYLREWKRRNRRKVLIGFPRPPGPLSREETESYLHGDEITCFLCGQPKKELGFHLASIHRVSADQYREMYGLPYHVGLTREATKEWKREFMSRSEQIAHLENVRVPHEIRKKSKHRISHAKSMSALENISNVPKQRRVWLREHAEQVIVLMEKRGLSLNGALTVAKLMGKFTFIRIVKEHEDLRARYNAIPYRKL